MDLPAEFISEDLILNKFLKGHSPYTNVKRLWAHAVVALTAIYKPRLYPWSRENTAFKLTMIKQHKQLLLLTLNLVFPLPYCDEPFLQTAPHEMLGNMDLQLFSGPLAYDFYARCYVALETDNISTV